MGFTKGLLNETNLSTFPNQAVARPRLPQADVHLGRPAGDQSPPGQGPQAAGAHGSRQVVLTFPKNARLSGDNLFGLILSEGKRKGFTGGEIFRRENGLPSARFGLRVSSKAGKAFLRTGLRRRAREMVRKNQALFQPGFDYLIIIRHKNVFPQLPDEKMPEYLFSLFGPEILQRVS